MSKIKLFLVCVIVLAFFVTGCGTTGGGGGEGVKGSAKYYKGDAKDVATSGYNLWGVMGENTDGYGKIKDEGITPESSSIKVSPSSLWEYIFIDPTTAALTTVEGCMVTAIYDGVLSSIESFVTTEAAAASPEAKLSDWNVDSPAAYKKVTDILVLIYPLSETLAEVDLATAEAMSFLVPNKYGMEIIPLSTSSKLGKKISSSILQPPGSEDWPADHPYWIIVIWAEDLENTGFYFQAIGVVDAKTGELKLFSWDYSS